MSFTDAELELLRAPKVNLAFFLRVETPAGVIRLYAGAGDFPLPADGIEAEGGPYTSVGSWGPNMPDLDHLRNAQVQVLDLLWSGVDLATVLSYVKERDTIIGSPAALGWAVLDERHRLAGPVKWRRRGYLARPTLSRQRGDKGRSVRTLGISLVCGPVRRRKPVHTYLTAPSVRRNSPTDAFADGVANLNLRVTRKWPN